MSKTDKDAALRALEGDDDDAVAVTHALEEFEEHPILSREDLEAIRKEAIEKVAAESRSSARKAVLELEISRARRAAGLTTGGPNDEPVNITLDLAEHSDRIVINGCVYMHGGTYRVPRHVADSMREIMYRGWRHQNEIDGKSLTHFYQKTRATVLNMATGTVANMPSRAA